MHETHCTIKYTCFHTMYYHSQSSYDILCALFFNCSFVWNQKVPLCTGNISLVNYIFTIKWKMIMAPCHDGKNNLIQLCLLECN